MLTALKLYLIIGEAWAIVGLLQPRVYRMVIAQRRGVAALTVIWVILSWPQALKRMVQR